MTPGTATTAKEGAAAGTAGAPSRMRSGHRRWELLVLLLPMLLLIAIVFDVPMLTTVLWSVADTKTGHPTLSHFQEFLDSRVYLRIIWRTVSISLKVTALCIVLGYPLAYWASRLDARWRTVVLGLAVTTFWVSILVRTYAWIVILGSAGLVNQTLMWTGLISQPIEFLYNEFGILVGMVNVLLPFLVLPLFAAMMGIDRRLLEVAETLGAGRMRIFWQVFFPLTVPTLAASAILVFILSLGFYITPAVLGGGRVPLIANMLDMLINRFAQWNIAAVVSVVLMAMSLSFYAVYQWLRGQDQ